MRMQRVRFRERVRRQDCTVFGGERETPACDMQVHAAAVLQIHQKYRVAAEYRILQLQARNARGE